MASLHERAQKGFRDASVRIGKPGRCLSHFGNALAFKMGSFPLAKGVTRPLSFETKDILRTSVFFGELLSMSDGISGHIFGTATAMPCDCSGRFSRVKLRPFPRRFFASLPRYICAYLNTADTTVLGEESSLEVTRNDGLWSKPKTAFLFDSCTRGPSIYHHVFLQFGACLRASWVYFQRTPGTKLHVEHCLRPQTSGAHPHIQIRAFHG